MAFASAVAVLLGVVITAIGMLIAFLQFKVAREKLRQDYFEQRFKVYFAFHQLILTASGVIDGDLAATMKEASLASSEARFLFDFAMTPYLNDLYKEAFSLWKTPELFNTSGMYASPAERADAMNRHQQERMQFGAQLEGLIAAFEPYLRADEWLLKRSSSFFAF